MPIHRVRAELTEAWRRIVISVLLAAGVTACVGVLQRYPVMRDLNLWGYDLLVNAVARGSPSRDIVIVDFDDATVTALGTYPIPRIEVAQVLDKVSLGKPAVIGIDFLLSDRRSDDAALAASIDAAETRGQSVVLASIAPALQVAREDPSSEFCTPWDDEHVSLCRDGKTNFGFVNLPLDEDGFVRRMLVVAKNSPGFSFDAAVAGAFAQMRPAYTRRKMIGFEGLSGTDEAHWELPAYEARLYSVLIGEWSLSPAPVYSVAQVSNPAFSPDVFRQKIVLIGQSSSRGEDLKLTPLFRKSRMRMPGVSVHAAGINTLLARSTITKAPVFALWLLTWLCAWLLIAIILVWTPLRSVLAATLLTATVLGGSVLLFQRSHLWLQFPLVECAILLSLPVGLGYESIRERFLKTEAEKHQEQLMSIFSKYVSPRIANEIWQRRDEIRLAGQEMTATVLFSDIRRFTEMSDGRPSAEVLAWLNRYFSAMAEVIEEQDGFLNKFIGDGIMALFGVPISRGNEIEAKCAVETALKMLERVDELNRSGIMAEVSPCGMSIGVGIHTGKLTAGTLGSKDRLEYTVIGETVNLASRLESLNKSFGTSILMSGATYELVKDFYAVRLLGETTVRGVSQDITIYTLDASAQTSEEMMIEQVKV